MGDVSAACLDVYGFDSSLSLSFNSTEPIRSLTQLLALPDSLSSLLKSILQSFVTYPHQARNKPEFPFSRLITAIPATRGCQHATRRSYTESL